MRILQVVTLISPDGAFGGPARVALNQSAELRRRGHDVTVTAATRGYRVPPTELNGVPVKLFPVRTLIPKTKFSGMGSPAMTRWFHAAGADFDLVHVHFGRDLVGLPTALSARRRRIPYVLQTHGMVVPSDHPLAGPVDTMFTRRALRDAAAVFYLLTEEQQALKMVGGSRLELVPLPNGVPFHPEVTPRPGPPEVLFAARLHARKRPLAFVEMAKQVLDLGLDARFTLIGPDEGEGAAVRAALGDDPRITWQGALPYSEMVGRMASAQLYVLPSVREPYPMSVLEAMSVGLPVVVSGDCGLAPLVARTQCGIVTEPTTPALVSAVTRILADRDLASRMGRWGRAVARAEFGMEAIGDRLVATYSKLVDGRR